MYNPPPLRAQKSLGRIPIEGAPRPGALTWILRVVFVACILLSMTTILAAVLTVSLQPLMYSGFGLCPSRHATAAQTADASTQWWDSDGDGDVDRDDIPAAAKSYIDRCGDGDGVLEPNDVLYCVTKLVIVLCVIAFCCGMMSPTRLMAHHQKVKLLVAVFVILMGMCLLSLVFAVMLFHPASRPLLDKDGDGDVDLDDLSALGSDALDQLGDGDGQLELTDVLYTSIKGVSVAASCGLGVLAARPTKRPHNHEK